MKMTLQGHLISIAKSCYFARYAIVVPILLNAYAANVSAAPACFSSLTLGSASTPPVSALVYETSSKTMLDFDGDGISEIVSANEGPRSTTFSVVSSKDASTSSTSLPGGSAVSADYDGDGKWDYAVARKTSKGIRWTINLSATGEKLNRTFGKSSSSILSGCRFLSSNKHSLATFDGTRLQAIQIGSSGKRTITFSKLSGSFPLGCGDATGDGIDELIVGGQSGSNSASTVSCVNDNVDYGPAGAGKNLSVLEAGTGGIPLIISERLRTDDVRLIRLNQLYDTKKLPHFYIPINAQFSFGIFSNSDNSSLGILWQNPENRTVTRQLFATPNNKENVAVLPPGYSLLTAQRVIKNID